MQIRRPECGLLLVVCLLVASSALADAPRSAVMPTPSIDTDLIDNPPVALRSDPILDAFGYKAPSLGSLFEGFGFEDNNTLAGSYFIPPDPIGVAGLDHVVAVGNVLIEWRDKSGANLTRQSLQSFFGAATATFDPKVIYDQHAQRFVVITLERDFNLSQSRILVAVSQTADPNLGWNFITINSKLNFFNPAVGATADHWADYPGLAIDDGAIYITNNMFTFSSNTFGDARLWILHKGLGTGGFYDGGVATWGVYDPNPTSGPAPTEVFTLQPSHVFGPNPASDSVFLTAAGWSNDFSLGNGSGAEYLYITRVDNPLTSPSFNAQFLSVNNIENAITSMPDAQQAVCPPLANEVTPNNLAVETNDRRSLHSVWRNNELWVTAQTVPEVGPDAGQATAHWWRVDTSSISPLVLLDQGDVGAEDLGPQTSTFFPSIAVNGAGDMAIGFAASNESIFPGAYYTGRRATDPAGQVDPTSVLAAGQDCYTRTFCASRNRWGDYSGSSVDPADDATFWIFNEYAIERGSPTVCNSLYEYGRWSTRWGSFTYVSPADLVVSLLEAPCCLYDQEVVGSQINLRVKNQGIGATATPVLLQLYLSADPTIDATDIPLFNGTVSVPPLIAGQEVTVPVAATAQLPPGPGPWYLGAFVDTTLLITESDETNNTAAQRVMVQGDPFGCMRGVASTYPGGNVSVLSVPNGSGRPLTAAQLWDGIPGSTPTAVDATIVVRLTDESLTPVTGQQVSLMTSMGGLVFCAGKNLADLPTDANGRTTFTGPLFAGGHTDRDAGEVAWLKGPNGELILGLVYGNPTLHASDQAGDLYSIDPNSGAANLLCNIDPAGITEIAFEPQLQLGWLQEPNGNFIQMLYDPFACTPISPPTPNTAALTGADWVFGGLFGVGMPGSCAASTLYFVDPWGGFLSIIGPTGISAVSGMAYNPMCDLMYGVTGCTATLGMSDLVTIDLGTGLASVVGNTQVELGGLAFGPDGELYAGGNTRDGANLYRVDRRTGAVALVGPTGMPQGVTGLTLVSDSGLDLRFNSPDINGDLVVNLLDVAEFATIFSSGLYDYAVDYIYQGTINLADIGEFSLALGATCPGGPKMAVAHMDPAEGNLRLSLDPGGLQDRGQLAAGETHSAYVVATGALAHRGLRAWEGALDHSSNLEITAISLVEGSLDLGAANGLHVGLGEKMAAESGALVLASIEFRLRDEQPASLRLSAPERSSVAGSGPGAVVDGEDLSLVAFSGSRELLFNGAEASTPSVLALDLHNVPNPFNPRTEIRFNLPRNGKVAVKIFDVSGRLVHEITPGELPAGAAQVVWEGTDRRGRAVTSGLYFYQVSLDGESLGSAKKMALVR